MICKETQQAVIEVLIKKTIRAAKNFKTKSILLGGGVVANQELRDQFQLAAKKMKIRLLIPDKLFCTDNAAMVGVSSYFYQKKKKSFKKIKAQANLRI
jgi:N6-L-threonylcarbamoyladenine synthase